MKNRITLTTPEGTKVIEASCSLITVEMQDGYERHLTIAEAVAIAEAITEIEMRTRVEREKSNQNP